MKSVRVPLWTLAVCASAAAIFGAPQLQALLIYNREAIDQGELWRLVSGNLVHFSAEHLLKDALALFACGTFIEMRRPRDFPFLCVASAAVIGMLLYVAQPEVLVYGGLSGIAVAAAAYVCAIGASQTGAYGWAARAAFLVLCAKIIVEFTAFPNASAGYVLIPLSHCAGAMTALALFYLKPAANALTVRRGEAACENSSKDRKFLRVRAAKCARLRRVSGR